MSYDTPVAPRLFDLLARSWSLPGPVGAVCFSRDGAMAAFCGGGALAVAPTADPERPDARMRIAADTARRTIQPRKNPVRPAAMVADVHGPAAPFGARSFVVGDAAGALRSVTRRGQTTPLGASLRGPVTAMAWSADGAHLAIGDALGAASLVSFPSGLFK